MKIKKFTAGSYKEVMEMVKKELGPDAVIIAQRRTSNGRFGSNLIEVTASIDEAALVNQNIVHPYTSSIRQINTSNTHSDMANELRKIREEIIYLKETLRPIVPNIKLDSSKKGHFNLLIRQGIDPQIAMILVEKSSASIDSLKETIASEIKIEQMQHIEEMGLMFIGPPGTGKTSSMAKIAYLLKQQKRHVNIMTLDDTRIESIAYMKDLSARLKCNMRIVDNIADLPKIIYKDTAKGPILIDTSGHEFRETLIHLNDIFPSGFPLKRCFLFDASMNADSVMKAWQSCRNDMVDMIGFTKLDMVANFGSLLNISMLSGKRLAFITTGPDIDSNLKTPTASYLASLILGGA